jgi:predicted nucleic acid-binding protein
MVKKKSMNPEKFLDTSYAIALSSSTDDYHHKALAIAQQLKTSKTPLVTTRAIILEIGNALSKQKYRSKSIKLLSSLEKDRTVTVIPLSEILYQKAFQLYCQRNDKNWGIVDCISFIVMEERRITEALTTDIHFQQAGFRALLRRLISGAGSPSPHQKQSPLLILKNRSPFAFLSQAMAILKFNQQDNSNRTFKRQRNCSLKVW